MSFWTETVVGKPTGIKDPDSVLDYPIRFVDWLADMDATYASHTVVVTGGLVCDDSSETDGVITVTLSGGMLGEKASFTVHIVTTDGRADDRTFYLKIKER